MGFVELPLKMRGSTRNAISGNSAINTWFLNPLNLIEERNGRAEQPNIHQPIYVCMLTTKDPFLNQQGKLLQNGPSCSLFRNKVSMFALLKFPVLPQVLPCESSFKNQNNA